jgi:hypothetical protein
MKHAEPSVMLWFKFPLLHGMEWSEIYSTIKCIHRCTVHQDRQHLETEKSVQCTEIGLEVLIVCLIIVKVVIFLVV